MLMCFHKLGYKNIIASDIDDLRTADIPIVFKGTDYITIKLISSDLSQIHEQMKNRPNNGIIDYELQEKMNDKNIKRSPLVNEVEIDVAGKSIDEVLEQAIIKSYVAKKSQSNIRNLLCHFPHSVKIVEKLLKYYIDR